MNPIYLLKVEVGANNNKFYKMIPEGDTFRVEYGRVGANPQTDTYPIDRWDKQLRSKLKKGYIDQTHLVAEIVSVKKSEYSDIQDKYIKSIVDRLQVMAKQSIEDNYTISSAKVTQAMIDEAQTLLNIISKDKTIDKFNEHLLNLFRVIPRKMKKVSENLANSKDDFAKIVQNEQDLLDTMRGQVVQNNVIENDDQKKNQTILDAMGLEFSRVSDDEINVIKKYLSSISDKFHQAWKVVNHRTQKKFDIFVKSNGITSRKLLWHGSRNENWWSIVNSGLVLRPNAIITGKMFGDGIYFAPKAQKSLGYTSLSGSYWANGNSNSAFMSLYDVAYGKPYNVYSFENKYRSFDYEKLQRELNGANCLHAHEGNMLRNDEIVVYKEEQLTIKYLVELK